MVLFGLVVAMGAHLASTRTPKLSPEELAYLKGRSLDSLQTYIDNYCDIIEKFEADTAEKVKAKLKISLGKSEKIIQSLTSQVTGSIKLTFKGLDYYIVVADLNKHDINLHWKDENDKRYLSIGNLLGSKAFKEHKPLMIANAGMYTEKNNPKGLYIEDIDRELVATDTVERKSNVNFYLLPNGVFYVDAKDKAHVTTTKDFWSDYKEDKSSVKLATQSGPMLVIDGKMHDKFRNHSPNLNIRNGVGVMDNGKVVFAISVGFVNFYDFASFYKDIFGCDNALYLDGAISRMYVHDLNPLEKSGNFGPMISVSEKVD